MSKSKITAADPIFAAIEAYRAAAAATNATLADADEKVMGVAFDTMIETLPTTTAGLFAVYEYVRTIRKDIEDLRFTDHWFVPIFLDTIGQALGAITGLEVTASRRPSRARLAAARAKADANFAANVRMWSAAAEYERLSKHDHGDMNAA